MPRPHRTQPPPPAGPSPVGSGGVLGAMADATETLQFMMSNAAQHETMAAAAGELPHWRRWIGPTKGPRRVGPSLLLPAPGAVQIADLLAARPPTPARAATQRLLPQRSTTARRWGAPCRCCCWALGGAQAAAARSARRSFGR